MNNSHYSFYFKATENEVVKASEYIDDFKIFVSDIETFCCTEINENVIRNFTLNEFENLINNFTQKFNDDVKSLLATKIIIEFIYRFYNTKYFPNIHQCLIKMEIVVNKKLSKFIYIDTKPESDRKSHHFGNSLAWIILDVYDRPEDYINNIPEDVSIINNLKVEKINWLSNERLIPYLFDALIKHNLISNRNIFSNISNHFTANGKEITRKNIKANYNISGMRDIVSKDKTIEMKMIDEIADKIKDLNMILSKL